MNKESIAALVAGVLFGLGLAVSGMVNPSKVANFLDVAGHWDPTLMLVMGGALAVTIPGFFFVLKMPTPVLVEKFHLPTRTDIDGKLIIGTAMFGIGWGLSGLCPAPAIVGVLTGLTDIAIFVVAMLAGMLIHQKAHG